MASAPDGLKRVLGRWRRPGADGPATVWGESLLHALGVSPAGDPAAVLEASAISPVSGGAGSTARAVRSGALARVLRTYCAARAAVAVGLLSVLVLMALLGSVASWPVMALCLVYAGQAIGMWWMPRFEALADPGAGRLARQRQWVATIGVDLLVFAALHVMFVGTTFSYAALLVLPVLMAGVMSPRRVALATAAAVALLLLAVAWSGMSHGRQGTGLLLQGGLAGLGMFVIALLSSELAARLVREELAARGSLELARQQAMLNRLVIEEMADGVLVVDRQHRVRAANPAARALMAAEELAPAAPFSLLDRPVWQGLAMAVHGALGTGAWPEEGREITLDFEQGFRRTLRVRTRFTRGPLPGQAGDPLVVLLLEDVRTAQARLRQEKLAAMGRVSAGVAHEIRNPLAAIAQANDLLLEDGLGPGQQRLARIISDNVARLRRLVDDVMEVAPGAAPQPVLIDAARLVAAYADDWARTVGVPMGPDSRLRIEIADASLGVMFDAEHLRRVMVNLLDNAARHAGPAPGAIVLRLAARDDAGAELSVLSDGPPIPPEVERHLFEPFSSTRSRGSGLGLYICRELCERYDAAIEYRARPAAERWRNAFVVTLRRGLLDFDDLAPPILP